MLRRRQAARVRGAGGWYVIVASRYNRRYVEGMVGAARAQLEAAGAEVTVVRVPGAYEIVLGAELVARGGLGRRPAAIVCLGVILRGETMHAELIGRAVTDGLMQVGLRHGLPVIHEVLLLENEAQAQRRCLDRRYNRGLEAAQTALQMARLVKRLEGSKPAQ
ncbi:6,7-dimethyl-8-ribityllumazine synthase [Limisphaera sp. VF-2]|uniref:6,7-dimethyl-8-ribityllumazine synthase n=1 Tax=Limisphaera sp. VF-2 TaxID=3400418 RepID=UPI001768F425